MVTRIDESNAPDWCLKKYPGLQITAPRALIRTVIWLVFWSAGSSLVHNLVNSLRFFVRQRLKSA